MSSSKQVLDILEPEQIQTQLQFVKNPPELINLNYEYETALS